MKNRSKPYFDEVEYQHFINAEIHAIEKSRFIESQKAHRDLRYDDEGNISNTHDSDWVLRHAKAFRQAWHDSACKTCVKVDECYECLKD